MTSTVQPPTTTSPREPTLTGSAALLLQASIIVVFLAASSAPTPMYALYQAHWHFSSSTVTVIFGVYALAVLAALLTIGSLSDHVGRRPVLFAALALQAVALLIFLIANGVEELLVARILQGLATGAAAGAVGAGMIDINPARGTIANAVAPMTGTATGALIAGIFVQDLPDPIRLIFWVLLAVIALQAAGVAVMAETATRRPGAVGSLRPRFDLPEGLRRPMLIATPALIAAWALAGFYGSLGPSLARLITNSSSPVLGGLSLFILAGAGAATVWALGRQRPDLIARLGTAALIMGVAITLLAAAQRSEAWFFLGTAVAGIGFGGGFQGAIRTVVPLATPKHRAGVLSIIYLISYLALGGPAVAAGVVVVHSGSLQSTARGYGIVLMILAAAALAGLIQSRRSTRGAAPAPALVTDEAKTCPHPCIG